MLAIGKITKRMALGYNIIPMEISMREVGARIRDTAKVLFGWLMPRIN